jgi:lipoyl(octanoyl) transferase
LDGATGVWLDVGTPHARKICAIGVKCSNYITMHGLALNVNTDLNYFDYINPCGFKDKGVTSVEKELGRKVEMSEIKAEALRCFSDVFAVTTIRTKK